MAVRNIVACKAPRNMHKRNSDSTINSSRLGIGPIRIVVGSLEHGALALLSTGEHQHGHLAALGLVCADLHQSATHERAFLAAHAVGAVRSVRGSALAGALLGRLPLRADCTVGSGAQASDAGLAGKHAAANAVTVVIGTRERHFSLADRANTAIAAGASAATAFTSANEVVEGLAALTSGKVLATFVLASRAGLQLLKRRRTAGLTNRVLAGATLPRAKRAGHGRSRETDRANKRRPGTLGSIGLAIQSQRRHGLLVAAAESVSRRRRERGDVLRRRGRLLRGRRAAGAPRAGAVLGGRGDLHSRGTGLRRRV